MINQELAIERGLSKRDIKDLNALHHSMNVLVNYYEEAEGWYWPRNERKAFAKTIRRLEYMLQDKWGFARDKGRHTHWRRFYGLKANTVYRTIVSSEADNG